MNRGWGLGVALVLVAGTLSAQSRQTLSLGQALETALSASRVLQESRQGLRVADQQVREAWASVFPVINSNASYSRNLKVQQAFLPAVIFDPTASPDELVPVRFGSDNTWQATLTVEQPLFEYGVLVGLGAAARYRRLERERLRGTTHQIVTAVRQAYLDALLAHEEVRLTTQSVARVRQTLAETRGLNRAGLASDYDVLRLEVQLANLEPGLARAENAVLAATRSLLVTVGQPPQQAGQVELEGRLNELDLAGFARNTPANQALLRYAGFSEGAAADVRDAAQAYEAARRTRSDLQQARLAVELERARVAAQRGEYFPTIRLFGSWGVTAQQNGSPAFFGSAQQRATSAVAGVRIELPIFNGFAREARVQRARAQLEQAEARLELAEFQAAREVETLVEEVREARRRVESQRQAVSQARRGFEIASAEYRAGLGSQLEIMDAEVALRQSEFNYAEAAYDYLLSSARLDAAVGQVPATAGEFAVN